jgi:hypothetical protein
MGQGGGRRLDSMFDDFTVEYVRFEGTRGVGNSS